MRISHLLFADDSLLFSEEKMDECRWLMEVLTQYEKALGQVINRQKTALFFSRNTRQEVQENIRSMFGAQVMTICEK